MVLLLLLAGAKLDVVDAEGRTATELASQRGHTQLELRMRAFKKSKAN